jgi:hypothetical protein
MKTIAVSARRNFLVAASLGAAGAVGGLAAATQRKAPDRAPTPDQHSSGYRASPHVLHYYKTTEV